MGGLRGGHDLLWNSVKLWRERKGNWGIDSFVSSSEQAGEWFVLGLQGYPMNSFHLAVSSPIGYLGLIEEICTHSIHLKIISTSDHHSQSSTPSIVEKLRRTAPSRTRC